MDGRPEPPRPEDPAVPPAEAVAGEVDRYRTTDLTRDWEDDTLAREARYEILGSRLPRHFPEEVRMDGVIRDRAYPDLAVLTPDFQWLVHRVDRGSWGPYGPYFTGPEDAHSYWLTHFDARSRPSVHSEADGLSKAQMRAYGQAVERHRTERGNGPIRALDLHYYLARTIRVVRLGFDGPEPPRESDPDFHEPLAVGHKEHVDANGLRPGEAPVPPPMTEAYRRFLPGYTGPGGPVG